MSDRATTLADVALVVMREHGRTCVWYGDPQLCHEIYSWWGGQHTHPLNTIATVVSALARSKKWRRDGYISHLGRRYPVYKPSDGVEPSPCLSVPHIVTNDNALSISEA
jgi:hypothetical protein